MNNRNEKQILFGGRYQQQVCGQKKVKEVGEYG
jgi:hypothetical protein